jgi:signal transduction histidine kinase
MQLMKQAGGWDGWKRRRAESVVETMAILRSDGESLAEVAHDARNMVTALGLYCDLLQEPGVLATAYLHYGSELRLVAAASSRLVEKLVCLETTGAPAADLARAGQPQKAASAEGSRQAQRWDLMPAMPIDNLAKELLANRNLLAALAGPSIALSVDTDGGALPVRLTGEDLTRVLVNLVKNAADAMPGGGKIQLHLGERPVQPGASEPGAAHSGIEKLLWLTIEDTGPGILAGDMDKIFESGFTTQAATRGRDAWPVAHRGLGLCITRSIIEGAGGRISAENRNPAGARFEMELPARTR